MHDTPPSLPDFAQWPSFPFEGDLRVKQLDDPVPVEPPRRGEGHRECTACNAPDDAYIWVGERWRVRAMDRPTGLPMVLILESRSHLDLGDLPNLLAAELGVMTVRLERAIRSLDGVARVHVNRWGDGSAHLHMWFLARPYGQLQLRGTFLPLWDSILPPISESTWRENLALVAAWLAEFGGRPLAEPPRIQWQAPSSFSAPVATVTPAEEEGTSVMSSVEETPVPSTDDQPSLPPTGDRPPGPAAASTRTATDAPAAEGADAPSRGGGTGPSTGGLATGRPAADRPTDGPDEPTAATVDTARTADAVATTAARGTARTNDSAATTESNATDGTAGTAGTNDTAAGPTATDGTAATATDRSGGGSPPDDLPAPATPLTSPRD
ncbi:hypothetical protein [Micromonospora sp. WMMC415]|uniref:hypothetical protein n=1 Tax=Micromonospora sp. WMMC415 TaxID=2675222 RepID=UPI00351A42D5